MIFIVCILKNMMSLKVTQLPPQPIFGTNLNPLLLDIAVLVEYVDFEGQFFPTWLLVLKKEEQILRMQGI